MENQSKSRQELDRRQFLKMIATLTALAYLPSCQLRSSSDRWGFVLPKRKLGKTGLDVTMFALGGGPANANISEEEAIVQAAFDGGCRFFETARSYRTEPAYGKVLKPYRQEIILSSKSRALDADTLTRELDLSLETLQTDYLDLYLMHNVATEQYADRKFNGGVWKAMVKAKEEGKVKHLGFSGHSNWSANNYMLDKNLPDLEVMLVPLNLIDTVQDSFVINTLPKAVGKDIGVIAMKPVGGGAMTGEKITWGQGVRGFERPKVIPDIVNMQEAQHFVYSLPISAASFGCTSVEQVEEDIALASSFTGMGKKEKEDLMARVIEISRNNMLEHYKHDNPV